MILLVASLASANLAASNWRCTYPGFVNPNQSVSVEFRRRPRALIDGSTVYRIVMEDRFGIVAASGASYPSDHRAVVSGEVIIINKVTGDFSRTSLAAPSYAPAADALGHCVQF